ncbi:MAG: hypothetical protein E6Z53_19530, partial [Pantoea sp.]|nr:hypothetical protein [Pantoea sp.]
SDPSTQQKFDLFNKATLVLNTNKTLSSSLAYRDVRDGKGDLFNSMNFNCFYRFGLILLYSKYRLYTQW